MGTYINFKQTDETKVTETAAFLEKHHDEEGYSIAGLWTQEDIDIETKKLKDTGSGCPDFLELGEGQFKLSATSDEDINTFIQIISEAVIYFGLTINKMPSNADDYLTDIQIDSIYGLQKFKDFQKKEEDHYAKYDKARKEALSIKQKDLKGGVKLVETWGIQKMWLIFGTAETPQFLHYTWEVDGEEYKDLYRDEKGLSYLLIPLMDMGPNGVTKVNDYLNYAWEHMGLRTQPLEILADVYNIYPKELKIGRVKLFEANYLKNSDIERGIYFDTDKNKFAYKNIALTDLYLNNIKIPQKYFISSSGITFSIASKDIGAFVLEALEKSEDKKAA